MRESRTLAALLLFALLLRAGDLWPAGRGADCKIDFQAPFDPGAYEFVIVSIDGRDRLRSHVEAFVREIVGVQPSVFDKTRFSFTELRVRRNHEQLARTLSDHAKRVAESPAKRAYVFVGDLDAGTISKLIPADSAATIVPRFDSRDVVASRANHDLDESEYYRRMSLHASLRAMLYWHHDDHVRVANITFEHMLSTPEGVNADLTLGDRSKVTGDPARPDVQ